MSTPSGQYDYKDVNANNGSYQFNGPIGGDIIINSKEDEIRYNRFKGLSSDEKIEDLFEFVKDDHDVKALQLLIHAGAKLNFQDAKGQTALHCAVEWGSIASVRVLKSFNASMNKQDSQGQTPVHYAAKSGSYDLLEALLEGHKTSLKLRSLLDTPDIEGKTAIHYVIHGLHVTVQTDETRSEWQKILDMLLAKGADERATESYTFDSAGHGESLVSKSPTTSNEVRGTSYAMSKASIIQDSYTHHIQQRESPSGKQKVEDEESASELIGLEQTVEEKESGSESTGSDGIRPPAVPLSDDEIVEACKVGDVSVIEAAIACGVDLANISASTVDEAMRLIHLAAVNGHSCVIRALLSQEPNPSDVNAESKLKGTALHCALERSEPRGTLVATVQVLLDHGASLSIRDREGFTPLHLAVLLHDVYIVELFLQHTSSIVNIRNDAAERGSRTALHYACTETHLDTVRVLLRYGADVASRDSVGWTPLHVISKTPNDPTKARHDVEHIIKLLLIHKKSLVNIKTVKGHTPLHVASMFGNAGIVKVLLDHGADTTIKDNIGTTALMYAKEFEYGNIVAMLPHKRNFFGVISDP